MFGVKVPHYKPSRVQGVTKKETIQATRLKLIKMLSLLEHKAYAAKRSQMAHLGLSSIPQLLRGLTKVSSEKNAVGDIAGRVHCLSPKTPRSLVLIEHRPSHLNKRAVLMFQNAVLWGSI